MARKIVLGFCSRHQKLLPNFNFLQNSYFNLIQIEKKILINFFSLLGIEHQINIIRKFFENKFDVDDEQTHLIIFNYLFYLFKRNEFPKNVFISVCSKKFLTTKNKYVLCSDIFYSDLIENDHQLQKFVDNNYISDIYIINKNEIDKYYEFFQFFKLKSKREIIFEFQDYLKKENSFQFINYIFELYSNKKIELKSEKLKNISLITNKGSYKYAKELILSDIYCEDVDLEKCIDKDIFVSKDYFNCKKKN